MLKQRHSFPNSFLVLWPVKMICSSPKATTVDIFRSAEENINDFKLNITFFLSTYPTIFFIIDLFYFRWPLLKNPKEPCWEVITCLPF